MFILANDQLLFKGAVSRLTRIDGLIFLALFGVFPKYTFGLSKIKGANSDEIKLYSLFKTCVFITIGFAGLFLGGKLLVDNTVIIARKLKVS